MSSEVTTTPKAKPLTRKQAGFVQGMAKGDSATVAALKVYDVKNYETAAVIASENLNKPNVRQAVDEALAEYELTASKAALIVKETMEYEGETPRDTLEMRNKGVDRFLKLLAMTEDKSTPGGNTIIFNDNRKTSKYVDSEG